MCGASPQWKVALVCASFSGAFVGLAAAAAALGDPMSSDPWIPSGMAIGLVGGPLLLCVARACCCGAFADDLPQPMPQTSNHSLRI